MTSPTQAPTDVVTTHGLHERPKPETVLEDLRALPRTLGSFVVAAVRWIVIDPVRDGCLRLAGRPRHVQVTAVTAIVVSVVVLLLTVFAGPVRSASDLSVVVGGEVFSFPRPVLGVIVIAVVLSVALFVAGSFHTPNWFRIPSLAVAVIVLAFVGSAGDASGGHSGLVIGLLGGTVVVAVALARHGRVMAWWEFPVALAVVVGVFAVAYLQQANAAQVFGIDAAPSLTGLVLQVVRLVAVPAAVVAGLAVAQVALSGMTMAGGFAARRLSSALFAIGAIVLLAWRLVEAVRGWINDVGTDAAASGRVVIGSGLALFAVCAVVVVIQRLGRDAHQPTDSVSDGEGGRSDTDALVDVAETRSSLADRVALPAGILLSITVIPLAVVLMVRQISYSIWGEGAVVDALADAGTFLNDDTTLLVTQVGAGVVLIVAAAVLALRGHVVLGELAGGAGAIVLLTVATAPGAMLDGMTVSPAVMDRLLVSAVAVATVVWVARKTFGVARQSAVVLVLLVSLLIPGRDFVSSPLTVLLGSAGIALVLFGFVWNFIADAGDANDGTDQFPRDARLMVFVAQALLGFAALAWVALARDARGTLDLGNASALGDAVLGVSMLVVVAVTIALRAFTPIDRASGGESGQLGRRSTGVTAGVAELNR